MIDFLYKIYHKFAGVKFVRTIGKIYRNGFFGANCLAYLRLKKLSKRKNDIKKPIRIIFICQYVQAWDKMKSVFELMLNDERFDADILAVPDINNVTDEKNYNYFKSLYGEKKVVNAKLADGWYDIKKENPDYVFYQRPYDQYLPKEYKSRTVSEYAKICHLVYGYLITETNKDICMNKLFFRNVYYYFAENSMCKEFNIKRFKKSHKKGYRKTVDIGYPILEHFMKQKSKYEKKDNNGYKVLWTPRWSESSETGGSSFMKFKDEIIKLPKEDKDLQVVFRPHPMTFDHFISVKKMTREQADEYINIYKNDEKLQYNDTAEYVDIFWGSDALLTDVSSIIVEYFITGKPIVYCDTGAVPDEFFKEMLKVMYVVKTYEEAKEKLLMLKTGKDPLKEERQKKVNELFGKSFGNISEGFLEEIYNDYIN